MDFRLLLRQIAVKHGTEDGASHGQHILGGREGGAEASENTRKPESLLFAKFNEGAGAENMSVTQLSFRVSRRRKVKRHLPCVPGPSETPRWGQQ